MTKLQDLINDVIGVHYDTDYVCIHSKYCDNYSNTTLRCHGYIEQVDKCFTPKNETQK